MAWRPDDTLPDPPNARPPPSVLPEFEIISSKLMNFTVKRSGRVERQIAVGVRFISRKTIFLDLPGKKGSL